VSAGPTAEAQDEIEKVARAVIAGEETIEVPRELTEEKALDAPEPDEAEHRSLWAQIQAMNVAQQVKLALKGHKDARTILLRSPNKLVQRLVLQNPRITEDEILGLAKNRNVDDDLLRLIAEHREWTALYQVKVALVENAKTPIPQALRLLNGLGERDIRSLAKSKNVPNIIAAQARRILFQRESTR
jgi:hypothetical protein